MGFNSAFKGLNQNPQGREMWYKICNIHRRTLQTEDTTGANHKQNRHNYCLRRKNLHLMCKCLQGHSTGETVKYLCIKKKVSYALIALGTFCACPWWQTEARHQLPDNRGADKSLARPDWKKNTIERSTFFVRRRPRRPGWTEGQIS